MRKSVLLTGAVALLGLGACGDQLSVTNVSNPDVDRVLSTADGVEATVAGFGSQLNNPLRRSDAVPTQAKILADLTFASVANFGMAARETNRTLIINDLGNDHESSNLDNYNEFQQLARAAANALGAFGRIKAAGNNTLSEGDENRMRAFAYLILGQAMGYVSFAYDSGAAVTEAVTSEEIPELVGAAELNAAAVAALDSAVIIAGRGMSDVPAVWMSQGSAGDVDEARFIEIARSLRARVRAGVARTPAQRAALDWASIIADATNGLSSDHIIQIGGNTGWSAGYDASQMYVSTGWGSLPMVFLGMADTSGAYQSWYNTSPSTRRAFLVQTADIRWPLGSTRAAQQADTPPDDIFPRYIRNRESGRDIPAPGTGENFYDHRRYGPTNSSATGGPFTDISKTEIDMLAAEGYIRTSQAALAVPLINLTRVANGLPAVTTAGVPVAPGCTPRLPNGTCGDLLEAMKYEKRMETAFTGYMPWFVDARGWGDIRANTAIEWPVPYQEMQNRQKAYYNGQLNAAATSTYGYCADGSTGC